MKLKDLYEMALRGGNLTAMADEWAKKTQALVLKDPSKHEVIGHIDGLVVRKNLSIVTVWDGSQMVMAARVDTSSGSSCVVDDVWVEESWRLKKLFSKFLLFLKTKLNQSRIVFGDVHSDETYQALRSGGFRAFKKHWENSAGETAEFSKDTVAQFYGAGGWKLVLECTADLSGFLSEEGFTHGYDALLGIVNHHQSL